MSYHYSRVSAVDYPEVFCFNGETWLGNILARQRKVLSSGKREMLRKVWLQTVDRNARGNNGAAYYVDRVTAIGNAQVPAVVRAVWGLLNDLAG